jgi:hypothetical protein
MSDAEPTTLASWRDALGDLSARLLEPTENLAQFLQQVVARAVTAVGAAEGSILVPDEANDLRFLVAHSPIRGKLVGLRVPISGSIAGYVYGTGQMMAVGGLAEERSPQFYAEIDRQVGVATRTYLVVPILFGNRVGGVATYVNRPGQPPYQPFQQHEMEQARAFAAVEAVLLRHLERSRQLAQLAAQDLAAAVAALSPEGPASPAGPPTPDALGDPWLRAVQQVESLSESDQALCTDLIGVVVRRRSQELA